MNRRWVLVLIVGIMITLVGILWCTGYPSADGFVNPFQQDEQDAKAEGRFGSYFQSMTNFFHNQVASIPAGGQIPSPILATDVAIRNIPDFGDKVNAALRQERSPVETPPEPDYSRYVRSITLSDLDKKIDECKTKTLDNLPTGNSAFCGWLYIPDSETGRAQQSIALPGDEQGPNKSIQIGGQPVDVSGGRQWFWHTQIADAKRKEQEKSCARLKFCNAINGNDSCAFNTSQGQGVYYDRKNPPSDNSNLITNVANCPREFSFCQDTTTDAERSGCVKQLLEMEGFSERGFLFKNTTYAPNTTDLAELFLLVNLVHERAKTPTNLRITADELAGVEGKSPTTYEGFKSFRAKLQYWKRLTTSYDPTVSDIAQMVVFGALSSGLQFSPTKYYAAVAKESQGDSAFAVAHKDFGVNVLQQSWRKAGCQPAGSEYPKEIPTGTKSLADIEQEYAGLYQSMFNAENERLQGEAIRKCLNAFSYTGPSAAPVPSNYCNERGIEYFVYDGVGAAAILIGRFFSNVGLLVDPRKTPTSYKLASDMRDRFLESSRYPQISYKARTMVSVPSTLVMNPAESWASHKMKYKVYVNKVLQSDLKAELPPDTRNILEIVYEGGKEDVGGWGAPKYSDIDLNLDKFQLYLGSTKPLISFGFFKDTYIDFNRVGALERTDSVQLRTFGTAATGGVATGMTWATEAPSMNIKLTPRIRRDVIRIISQRLWISNTPLPVVLYRLQDSENVNYVETAEIIAGPKFKYSIKNGFDTQSVTVTLADFAFSTWKNVAAQFTISAVGELDVSVFVNNVLQDSTKKLTVTGERFRRPIDIYVMNKEFNQESGMGWFRVYDRLDMSIGGIEGFVGSSAVPSILKQEESGADDPMARPAYVMPPSSNTRPAYMVYEVPNYTSNTLSLEPSPTNTSNSTTATCPFDKIQGKGLSVNYTTQAFYGQAFNTLEGRTGIKYDKKYYARECEDLCKGNCIGYTFDSKNNTCTTFTDVDLGPEIKNTKPEPNSFSVIMKQKGDTFNYQSLKADVLKAIANYKQMKKAFEDEGVFSKLFTERAKAGESIFSNLFGAAGGPSAAIPSSFTRIVNPRSDAEITADASAVEKDLYSMDCLNGILKKYSFE